MPVKQQHTETGNAAGDAELPLYDFFLALRHNGFLVTPAQIADSHAVIAQFASTVKTEGDLCHYLSPIFASDEDDQERFRKAFDRYFNQSASTIPNGITAWQKWFARLKQHWWKYTVALVLAIICLVIFQRKKPPEKTETIVLLDDTGGGVEAHLKINQPIKISVRTDNSRHDSIYRIRLNPKYDWGDGSVSDSSNTHQYTKKGIYQLTTFVAVYYGADFRYADTLREKIKVCDENNSLNILNSLYSDSVKKGGAVHLSSTVTGRAADSILWTDGNGHRLAVGPVLDTAFYIEGFVQINCTAIYDSVGSPCSLTKSIYLQVYDPNKAIYTTAVYKAPGAGAVLLKRKVKPGWFWLVGGLFILSFIGMLLYAKWQKAGRKKITQQKEDTDQKYNELVNAFAGKKPPFDLPFRGKNSLPWPEPGLNELAWQMRRRIEDESTYLHLQKTILRSIGSAGFFQPVLVPRTMQSEWLVLIDETTVNDQQAKLFDYLVEMLRKQNVFIDKFYYRETPGLCYNVNEPGGISLEKLQERFPLHVLLIFGNGYQLVSPHYPVFDADYRQLIRRWKYKAVITPMTVPDWGAKEKFVLSEEIPVLPVDVYGLLLLLQKLFSNEETGQADLEEHRDQYYKVTPVDFEDIEELHKYCHNAVWARLPGDDPANNILFQWVAALALYPRVRWEIIIATGKAILEKYGKSHELNFTNLLRIARIKWMQEGRFPDYTRLELLKLLKIDNEVKARETILSLLNEIPDTEISADHFAFEEKEIQRVINEFNLYAYDPLKYSAFEGAKDLFQRLWQEKKILDGPAKVYLKNEDREWTTLVNKPSQKDGSSSANIPLEEYLEVVPEDSSNLKSFKLWTGFFVSLLFLGSLLGLILLTILNFLNTSSFSYFTYKKSVQHKVVFTLKDSSNSRSFYGVALSIDTTKITLVKDSAVAAAISFDDSTNLIGVLINGEQVFAGSQLIDHDAYIVSLKTASTVTEPVRAIIYLNSTCAQSIYTYKGNISDADKNIIITDTTVNSSGSPDKGCVNQISYGAKVDISLVNRIVENFKKSGTGLSIVQASIYGYPISGNEIAIYYADVSSTAIIKKPTIYIQLSDESLRASAEAFKKKLETTGYTVSQLTVADQNMNSRISYYSSDVTAEVAAIQKLYRSYYPALPIPVQLVGNSRLAGSNDVINIFIKKLESKTGTSFPVKLNDTGQVVRQVQDLLITMGYKAVIRNGIFDQATQSAVKDFQAKNKLFEDGIVGPMVMEKLSQSTTRTFAEPTIDSANSSNTYWNQQSNVVYESIFEAIPKVFEQAETYFSNLRSAASSGSSNYSTRVSFRDSSVRSTSISFRNNEWSFRFLCYGNKKGEKEFSQKIDALITSTFENNRLKFEKTTSGDQKKDSAALESYQYINQSGYRVEYNRGVSEYLYKEEIIIYYKVKKPSINPK